MRRFLPERRFGRGLIGRLAVEPEVETDATEVSDVDIEIATGVSSGVDTRMVHSALDGVRPLITYFRCFCFGSEVWARVDLN